MEAETKYNRHEQSQGKLIARKTDNKKDRTNRKRPEVPVCRDQAKRSHCTNINSMEACRLNLPKERNYVLLEVLRSRCCPNGCGDIKIERQQEEQSEYGCQLGSALWMFRSRVQKPARSIPTSTLYSFFRTWCIPLKSKS